MPDRDEALIERSRRILAQALDEAEIDRGRDRNWTTRILGGTNIHWEQLDEGFEDYEYVELVINVAHFTSGRIKCSFRVNELAQNIARLFPQDSQAVSALADAFEYVKGAIAEILPQIDHNILARGINLLNKTPISPQDKQLLKTAHSDFVQPLGSALETKRKELQKQLRAEPYRRGGSEPKVEVSDAQALQVANEYPTLLKHWQNIKKWQAESMNWREHAKVDVNDTPDDLLDKLADQYPDSSEGEIYPNIPSVLAYEHAARRAGIPSNTYSSSTLKNLRRRGTEIRGQVKNPD